MQKHLMADISLLLVTFIWGATFVLVQNAISFLPPLTFNAVRFLAAALMLAAWLFLFARDQLKHLNRKLILSGILMGIWLFSGYALQTFGLLYTTSSKAGFITGLSVVLVPLFSLLILKQKPAINAVAGAAVATAGLFLLTAGDQMSLNKGDILVFFCAISFAMHIIFTGKFASSYPALLLTITQITTVAVLCSLTGVLFEKNWKAVLDLDLLLSFDVITALLVTSVLATAFAFIVQTKFQAFTTPARVALIFAMEPVFAAATAYFLADERLTAFAVVGCVLIFAGMVLAELPAKKWIFGRRAEEKAM